MFYFHVPSTKTQLFRTHYACSGKDRLDKHQLQYDTFLMLKLSFVPDNFVISCHILRKVLTIQEELCKL